MSLTQHACSFLIFLWYREQMDAIVEPQTENTLLWCLTKN